MKHIVAVAALVVATLLFVFRPVQASATTTPYTVSCDATQSVDSAPPRPYAMLQAETPIQINAYKSKSGKDGQSFDSESAGCQGNFPTTQLNSAIFFNPADNRVDGQTGDRIGVYCKTATELEVLGGVDGEAVGYAVFNLSDLLAAGEAGETLPLRSYLTQQPDNLSHISVQLSRVDGNDYVYVTWNGGTYTATGQHDFVKMFDTRGVACGLQ
jgi:hypothetical protein